MKRFIFILTCFCLVTALSFAQTIPSIDAEAVSDGLNTFAIELLDVVPNVAVQQGVWADAWIGKFIPSVPPHFGGGFTVGVAKLNPEGLNKSINEINKIMSLIDYEIPNVPKGLVLPTITADLRIGGIFLPFDLGISVMKIPTVNLNALGSGLSLNFFTIGASLRVPVIKGNVILPKVSVGAGFMYSSGAVNVSADKDLAYVGTDFDTKTLFLEAQVSKSFAILTPFVGIRGVLSDSSNNWAWKYGAEIAGNFIGDKGQGNVSRSFNDNFVDNFQCQFFGGLSLNIAIIRTTVSASYDIKNNIWGGNLSLRLKI